MDVLHLFQGGLKEARTASGRSLARDVRAPGGRNSWCINPFLKPTEPRFYRHEREQRSGNAAFLVCIISYENKGGTITARKSLTNLSGRLKAHACHHHSKAHVSPQFQRLKGPYPTSPPPPAPHTGTPPWRGTKTPWKCHFLNHLHQSKALWQHSSFFPPPPWHCDPPVLTGDTPGAPPGPNPPHSRRAGGGWPGKDSLNPRLESAAAVPGVTEILLSTGRREAAGTAGQLAGGIVLR